MRRSFLLLVLAASSPARADAIARVGASADGLVAGGQLVVGHRAIAIDARADLALDRAQPRDRGELAIRLRLTPPRAQRRLSAIAGVRLDDHRVFSLAGLRFGESRLSLELGVAAHVGGAAMYVQHARYSPGWFARGELRSRRVVLGGELGTSGLAVREPDGTLRGDTRALLTIGVELWRHDRS